ncbi:MAG: virulence RhuM family protein, partial [Roseburia sp.]|nr:virulence RhuM family protein [Roseburia sp.]
MLNNENKYDLIKFEDGEFSLDVNVSPNEDTVWLTANQMAILFNVQRPAILKHISNILSNKELDSSTCSFLEQVQIEGNRHIKRKINCYNLDMIISVGYRVNSKRGILFRKWATSVLKQYMMNGYAISEKRCLECQENLVSLNNKVNTLIDQTNDNTLTIQELKQPSSL